VLHFLANARTRNRPWHTPVSDRLIDVDALCGEHSCVLHVSPADDGASLPAIPGEPRLFYEFDIVVLSHRINELGSNFFVVKSLGVKLRSDVAMGLFGLLYFLAQLLDSKRMLVFCYILLHQPFLILILLFLVVNGDFEHFAFVFALYDFVLNDHWVLECVVELADVELQLRNLLLLLMRQYVQLFNFIHSAVKFLGVFLDRFDLGGRLRCLLGSFFLLLHWFVRLHKHLNHLSLFSFLILNCEPELLDGLGEDLS
jgi:hypothetical protein